MTSFSCSRSIPTVDRISNMPDSILSHILSFLPTKLAVTTSILSKRWKPVWHSVFTLDFDDKTFQNFDSFRRFVNLAMFRLRDKKTPIYSFTFKLGHSSRFHQKQFDRIFKFVMERGVKNLNFNMTDKRCSINLPPRILSCNTLQILTLGNLFIKNFDKVDFPLVKTLHLDRVYFTPPQCFVKFIYGFPILEDLNAKLFLLSSRESLDPPIVNLNALPNLANVKIWYGMKDMMTLFCKAKILYLEQIYTDQMSRLPMFHNLTHMELYRVYVAILAILPHFPNLQHLIIKDSKVGMYEGCGKHPPTVAECLSSQLKICCIRSYKGTKHEFEFVKYIMKHSIVLETLKIQSTCLKMDQKRKLSSCTRSSTTCKLLFD